MSKIICLDPGHGGSDPGATKGKREESNDALKMTLAVGKLIAAQGVKVVYTRTTDKDITINERCNIANKNNADYFLSIHRNSSVDSRAKGYEIWVHSQASSGTQSKAKTILDNVIKVDGRPATTDSKKGIIGINRGVRKGAVSYTDYGINKYSNAPSALFEMSFISNSEDNNMLDNKFNQIAEAIAKGLCSIVGITYKTSTSTTGGNDKVANLKKNDSNEAVFALKALLNAARELGIVKTGVAQNSGFGDGTEQALKEFQKYAGLKVTGITSIETMNALFSKISEAIIQKNKDKAEAERKVNTFKLNDSNNAVFSFKAVILELRRKNIIPSGVDVNGGFGGGTEAAVKAIQKKSGLKETGIVDTDTIRAANKLLDEAHQKSKDTAALETTVKSLQEVNKALATKIDNAKKALN